MNRSVVEIKKSLTYKALESEHETLRAQYAELLKNALAAPDGRFHFKRRIESMNRMYELPVSEKPWFHDWALQRLRDFKDILQEECEEMDDIIDGRAVDGDTELRTLVKLADLLGDITVYCRSEALRWGLPLEEVLDIIMDSNASKLGADGRPIKDERGKFLKGPNYWKPEPKIEELLRARIVGRKP